MFCMHCGAKLIEYARYCPYCGTKVEDLYFESDENEETKQEITTEQAEGSDAQELITAAAAIAKESKVAAKADHVSKETAKSALSEAENVKKDRESGSLKRILLLGLVAIIAAGLIGLGVRALRNAKNAQTEEAEQQEEIQETEDSVGQYIASSSDISKERLTAMQEHAKSVLSIQLKNTTSGRETIGEMAYLGNYTLVNKDYESNGGYQSIFYLVYHVTTVNSSQTEQEPYYWYIGYHDIKINADDDDSDDYTATATPTAQTGKYYGYASLEELYQSVVKDNRGNYIFEDNVEDVKPEPEEENQEEQAEETTEEQQNEQTEEQTSEEIPPATPTDGQFFPDSSSTLLTQEQIRSIPSSQRRYAVNEIYARHGYIFMDADLQSYYEQFSWYTPTTPAASFSYSVFNYTEQQNIMNLNAAQ